uniref:Uncharacterized protein n=1 Tax=Pogona vitticeps TaxID=103695 RepID=A0ABM5EJ27_9SAUR
MGETTFPYWAAEGCCLEVVETILFLVTLIIILQLAVSLAPAICYYVCCIIRYLYRSIMATVLSGQCSHQDLAHRRRRERSRSPPCHCLLCIPEPIHLTMNVQNEEHHRVGRRPYPDYLPCHPPRYYHPCDCENRSRPRTALAPAGYAPIVRCRDVAVGTSEPMLYQGSQERRNDMAVGTEFYPRTQVGETHYRLLGPSHDAEYTGGPPPRSHRPTKVYIYPVHPQTPPGSRSASPERLHRRRGATTGSQEDQQQEFETQEPRRKAREPEQHARGAPPRFHTVATSVLQRAAQTEASGPKQQHPWSEAPADSDWVYRPL